MRLPMLVAALGSMALPAAADDPSFNGGRAAPGIIEAQACARPALAALDKKPVNAAVQMFLATDPSAVIEHGDGTSMMFLHPTANGARAMGRNESLWEHPGKAHVVWGDGALEMTCTANR